MLQKRPFLRRLALKQIMKRNIYRRGKCCAIYLTVISFFILPISAQKANPINLKVFEAVPKSDRRQLVAELTFFVGLYKTGDAAAVYDLLFGPITEKMSKDEYVKGAAAYRGPKIIDFRPTRVARGIKESVPRTDWVITGEVKMMSEDQKEETKEGVTFARFQDGKWYFSPIWMNSELRFGPINKKASQK
jgi:hypothetical protein